MQTTQNAIFLAISPAFCNENPFSLFLFHILFNLIITLCSNISWFSTTCLLIVPC